MHPEHEQKLLGEALPSFFGSKIGFQCLWTSKRGPQSSAERRSPVTHCKHHALIFRAKGEVPTGESQIGMAREASMSIIFHLRELILVSRLHYSRAGKKEIVVVSGYRKAFAT
jgi:hypothetical protein